MEFPRWVIWAAEALFVLSAIIVVLHRGKQVRMEKGFAALRSRFVAANLLERSYLFEEHPYGEEALAKLAATILDLEAEWSRVRAAEFARQASRFDRVVSYIGNAEPTPSAFDPKRV